eukprot:scaffold4403_cov133-Amphora_coffeaeformis.AAC.2
METFHTVAKFIIKRRTTPETVPITVEMCKSIPELKDPRGPKSIQKRLEKKESVTKAHVQWVRKKLKKTQNEINKVIQPKLDKADKNAADKEREWKKAEA